MFLEYSYDVHPYGVVISLINQDEPDYTIEVDISPRLVHRWMGTVHEYSERGTTFVSIAKHWLGMTTDHSCLTFVSGLLGLDCCTVKQLLTELKYR